jgi:hypothetical protein
MVVVPDPPLEPPLFLCVEPELCEGAGVTGVGVV